MKLFESIERFKQLFARHPLTQDDQLRAWLRMLSWQIVCRFETEVLHEWISGQYLSVTKGMTGATGNIYTGLHEFADMMFLLHYLRPGDLFFDIGANVGTYTVLASGVCCAQTWAFEPSPLAIEKLQKNIEVNALRGLVTIYPTAVSDSDGYGYLTVGLDTMNSIVPHSEQTQDVPMVKLDSVASKNVPSLMKIDVEGHDEAVIRGARSILSNQSLQALEVETVTRTTVAVLNDHGFKQVYYDPFCRALRNVPITGYHANNLFVRDCGAVMDRLIAAEPINILGRSI